MHFLLVLPTFFLIILTHPCRAAPSSGFVSIPITRTFHAYRSSTLPPTIVHQQHANRGIRRLERMKGRNETPDHDLLSNIQKRASFLSPTLRKRYYHANISSYHSDTAEGSHRHKLNTFQTSPGAALGSGGVDGITKASQHTFPNSLGLDIQANDEGYIGTVQIGTPPRNFQLLMDSGSADLWVGAEGCKSLEGKGCGDHTFLGPKSSSSLNDTGHMWSIQYGTGAVSGHIVTDHVVCAGLQLKSLKFGIALKETEDLTSAPFDGLVGLARPGISKQQATTLVEALYSEGLIQDPIVAYKLPRLADGKNDGEVTFGVMNPAKFDTESVVTVPNINDRGFWEGAVDGVVVNGKDMGWMDRTAIFDTGTTLVIAPRDDVDKIHHAIPGASFDGVAWTVPCTTTALLSLFFGAREFSVHPRDLAFMPVDPTDPKGDCTSGISPGNIGADTEWLIGDVFLKNVYLSTNAGTNQISLAKLVD